MQQPCPIRCNSTCYYLKSPWNLSIFRWDSWNERYTEQIYRFSKYVLNLLLKIQFYSREVGMDAKTKISRVQSFSKGNWSTEMQKGRREGTPTSIRATQIPCINL